MPLKASLGRLKRLFEPAPPPDDDGRDAPHSLLVRLGWFFGLAMASASVVIVTAYVLRGFLFLD